MKTVLYAFVLSLFVGGTSQAQEPKKTEHKMAKTMDHKAKTAKEGMKDDKAKMDKKMKKS